MTKTISYFFQALAFTILASCGNQKTESAEAPSVEGFVTNQTPKQDSLETLDTTIILKNLASASKYRGAKLSKRLAKKVLCNHFTEQGYFTRENVPDSVDSMKTDVIVVDYDTIYEVNLNSDNYTDAVITYWLVPYGANGHCFRPHYAIIINSDSGYEISNEEFISDDFSIDSTFYDGFHNVILGAIYNCGAQQEFVRRFRLTLK